MLRRSNGRSLPSTEESVIRAAIAETLASEPAGRNLDAFRSLLRGRIRAGDDDLVARLEKWVRRDQLGWLFNNAEDRFSWVRVSGFDMTRVLDDPTVRTAALMYIFHRIDELLMGGAGQGSRQAQLGGLASGAEPAMIFLDEGWRLLGDEVFAHFITDKMKTIRKLNGIVGFGTQSAADIVRSRSANTLIEPERDEPLLPEPEGGRRELYRSVPAIRSGDELDSADRPWRPGPS